MAVQEHSHHRWDDKAFWTIQRKLLALSLTLIALAGCFTLIVQAQAVFDPHIAVVALRLDSVNHVPILLSIEELRKESKKTDTNVAIIKSIIEVLATRDQLIAAQERRTNPTGIR